MWPSWPQPCIRPDLVERQAKSFESPCANAGAQVGTVIAMMLPFSTFRERSSAKVGVVPKYGSRLNSSLWASRR